MDRVKQYFISRNAAFLADRIHVFTESSATAELAAQRLGCDTAHIAKSLGFLVKVPVSKEENKRLQQLKASSSPTSPNETAARGFPIIIVASGDAKVSKKKLKIQYGCSPKMFKREEVEELVGYPAGGVCPFGVNPDVKVYLDVSLKRFEKVYPGTGSVNSVVSITCEELEEYASNMSGWVDVCDGWQRTATTAADENGATSTTA